ncbi:MAG: hypothetical protein GF411_02435 [Candidatus Lokiarchaeota archaeon]|nr:hypothetical protein [Candidatus Lokiarchaeota archaeon]
MDRTKSYALIIFLMLLSISGNHSLFVTSQQSSTPQSCTIATLSIGDSVLFGNNEDYSMKGTAFWFVPSDTGYGAVIFGYYGNWHPADGFAQGGMNEMGLCCDANALSDAPLNAKPELEPAPFDFFPPILEECATVNDTINWFQTHDFGPVAHGQFHFADANGDAVVISAGENGEWAFSRLGDDEYLLSTNFNLVNPDNGWHPCWRYETADEMLSEFNHEANVTVSNLADVMQATIQTGAYPTQYTNIFNPKSLDFYVWHNGDFSEYRIYNLADELENLTEITYHKIPVELGEPDWFFPPQLPVFVAIPVGIVAIVSILIVWYVKRRRK